MQPNILSPGGMHTEPDPSLSTHQCQAMCLNVELNAAT